MSHLGQSIQDWTEWNLCKTVFKKFEVMVFHDGGCYHIETSPLICCSANQWTGFYMIMTSVIKELTRPDHFKWSISNIHFLIILTIFKTVIIHDFRKTWWRDFEKTLKVLISGPKMTHLSHFLAYWELSFKIQSRYFYPFITVCSHIQLQKKNTNIFQESWFGPNKNFP